MDGDHDFFSVGEMMPGAMMIKKINKKAADKMIAEWDRLPPRKRRCVWFAIDWGDGKKCYELLSNRESAVVHATIDEEDIPKNLTLDPELTEKRGFDVYTPGASRKVEGGPDEEFFPHEKVSRKLKNGETVTFENVPSDVKDEAMYYINEGYSFSAETRENGNYNVELV